MKNSTLILYLCLFGIISLPKTGKSQAAIIALIFGDKVASEDFNISLELGFNGVMYANLPQEDKIRPALNFGIAGNIKLNENWFFSPTIYFVSKRAYLINNYSLESGNTAIDNEFQNKDGRADVNYIDVPLLLCYQTNNHKWRFGLAPQVSFLSTSTITLDNDFGSFTQDIKSSTNNFDYGILANVGYSLGEARKGKGIYVQLRYYYGFEDVYKDFYSPAKNNQSYVAVHFSLPFITDALAEQNLENH